MMKIFLFGLLALISLNANAEGLYDGIWQSESIGYFSVHERDGDLVIIRLSEAPVEWEAFLGTISGNTVKMETIISGVQAIINVTFTSESSFSAIQESCRPLTGVCLLPDGIVFQGKKIW